MKSPLVSLWISLLLSDFVYLVQSLSVSSNTLSSPNFLEPSLGIPESIESRDLIRSVRFDNHLLIQIGTSNCTPNQKSILHSLLTLNLNLDVWSVNPKSMDVQVSPEEWKILSQFDLGACVSSSISILEEDVQGLIDRETSELNWIQSQLKKNPESYDWFDTYHRYSDILHWYQNLTQTWPTISRYDSSLGETSEGRHLVQIRISDYSVTEVNWSVNE